MASADDLDLDRMLARMRERQQGKVPGAQPGTRPAPPPVPSATSEQVGDALGELAKRNLLQHIRLHKLARWAASLAARIVQLRAEHAAELEGVVERAQAERDKLLALHNEYRAAHGDPPVRPILANWDGSGEFTTAYAALVFSDAEGSRMLGPDGFWHTQTDATGVAPTGVVDEGAISPPPGATPGTTREDAQ